jgi:hypothetical protein
VGIKQNELVDQLAKNGINQILNSEFKPTLPDLKIKINNSIKRKWSDEWNNVDNTNKLKLIKTEINPWNTVQGISRKESIVLTRLRIGHSWLTHSYIIDKRPQPLCRCGYVMTVLHIFTSCEWAARARQNHDISLASLADNNKKSIRKIIDFIKDLNIYTRI